LVAECPDVPAGSKATPKSLLAVVNSQTAHWPSTIIDTWSAEKAGAPS
jgi:hypothetical protein